MLTFNTFSITARCARTGQFGIAISTKIPAVGSLTTYAKAGIGAIASQSFVNPYIGINGLKYLEENVSAQEVLDRLLEEDPVPEIRQFSIVDKHGQAVAFTGDKSDSWKGHLTGENYAVAGNMLVNEATIEEMAQSFEKETELPLADRLLQALQAGQNAGGDKRGKQSGALYIVDKEEYPFIDLRVDEHHDPVVELTRVYKVAQKELFPFVRLLPTLEKPAGSFDLDSFLEMGILQHDDD
ncbi:DUF1028 domain-containing protein [Pseudogracilibacillus auburnensis]|uniref:Putative Ntn-hydrolase superfamily protein n=1 Tax=Pseudogracilibacillus auburnensis TaxID=1494959 RepID=A0A2V3WE00_9BACI|nr:DUF1028 domain-containing protein [Pseudogracilibacillus auburnensis]MBO1002943.1 DUF1028 domain-containing protein [Pseudogracilibacillus auburnensis]PXW87039.1 putative Ntn-hydrolase superfamily protein [Pseudogracilibacillus auburnensis]